MWGLLCCYAGLFTIICGAINLLFRYCDVHFIVHAFIFCRYCEKGDSQVQMRGLVTCLDLG